MDKYEKLREIIAKHILDNNYIFGHKIINIDDIFIDDEGLLIAWCGNYSYHDLFSVESGLMESVKRKRSGDFIINYGEKNERDGSGKLCHYFLMSFKTAEEKIDYFLENIIDG